MLYINDRLQEIDLGAALATVSPQRRSKAMRFKREHGRRECVAAYLLLMEGLRKEYGITECPVFEYAADGKPRLHGLPGVEFNLSHCREAAVCAVSSAPVGVDVETVRPFKDALARYVLSAGEYAAVTAAARPDVEFIKLWTRKEALLKLTGEGIRSDLKTVLSGNSGVTFDTVVTERYVYTVARYKS